MRKFKFANQIKLAILAVVSVALVFLYLFYDIDMDIFDFVMHLRKPKLLGMIICGFCIGFGTMIFQSIIRNRVVTPCLLGMNSLYSLTHTAVAFIVGVHSPLFANQTLIYGVDIVLMGVLGTVVYGFLFKKTKYNILYILLAGTVISTLFSSISTTMTRLMDPEEYDVLLTTLVAGFDRVNEELIFMSCILIVVTIVLFYRDIRLLNVITLGKDQAINLGVNYDRTIKRLLVATSFFITIATALVGPISFLGLIIANLTRELFKTYKHVYLLIGCSLLGIAVLLGGQTLIEHVFGFGMQISVLINLFGGGYFLYLIIRNKTT